jgi:universal stress protein E
VPVTVHLEKGEPGAAVPAILDEYRPGVIVMGTLARAGLQAVFMGNAAERVLGNTVASVVAVKPEGFTTPVAV